MAESSLHHLFAHCRNCNGQTTVVVQQVVGSMVVVNVSCIQGHKMQWESQPTHGTMPWGNLRCAAAILFSGSSVSQIITLSKHLTLPLFSHHTFNKLQKCYLVPAIVETWRTQQSAMLSDIAGHHLVVGGDGRCDSPGFSAKYGSYTVMDLQRQRVIDVQLVQVFKITTP